MMRSNTSMTGPTTTTRPVSSTISRVSAVSSASPTSTVPPGRLQCPFNGSYRRRISTTFPASTITAPTPTIGRSGYSRRSFTLPPSRFSVRVPLLRSVRASLFAHHLDDNALAALPVELRIEHLFPWTEIELARGDRKHHLVAHDRAFQMRVGV